MKASAVSSTISELGTSGVVDSGNPGVFGEASSASRSMCDLVYLLVMISCSMGLL